eukprot:48009_1
MASCIIAFVFILVLNTVQSEVRDCWNSDITRCSCFEAGPCELRCIGNQECREKTLICISGYPCTVICDSHGDQEACEDVTINTNGATSIQLECIGKQACQRVDLVCDDVDQCDISCDSGFESCEDADLDCVTSNCNLDCAGDTSCTALTAITTDAQSFECTNACSASNSNIPSPKIATLLPTQYPSNRPSSYPSKYPSNRPSTYPSPYPSNNPSVHPSKAPSNDPSMHPTKARTNHPSVMPTTNEPSEYPSTQPTVTRTDTPSFHEIVVVVETTETKKQNMRTSENGENSERNGIMDNVLIVVGSAAFWLYIGIGSASCCCLLILCIAAMECKENRKRGMMLTQTYIKQAVVPAEEKEQQDNVMDDFTIPMNTNAKRSVNKEVQLEFGHGLNAVEMEMDSDNDVLHDEEKDVEYVTPGGPAEIELDETDDEEDGDVPPPVHPSQFTTRRGKEDDDEDEFVPPPPLPPSTVD